MPLDSIPLPPMYSMLVISTQHDVRFRPFQGSFLNFVSILLNQDNLAHRFQSPSLSKQNSLADIPALIFFVAEDVMSTIHLMERDAIPHIVPACSHTCPHLRHEHLEATHLTLGVHRTGGIWAILSGRTSAVRKAKRNGRSCSINVWSSLLAV